MLHLIKTIADQFYNLLSQDPVRPSIPHCDRIGDNKDVFVLRSDDKVRAITCISYQSEVPTTESELFAVSTVEPTVAVFYTIWSYVPGAGRQLIFDAVDHIKIIHPSVTRFVTLSPTTDTARRFHLRNGAEVFRTNLETVNYEYLDKSAS